MQGPARGSGRRVSRHRSRKHMPVALEGAGDIVEQLQPAPGEDRAAVAILADRLAVMRRQDDVGTTQALAKRSRAPPAEPLVADLGDLVDQIDVEVDREARAKGEPGAHSRRIRIDWHVEIFAELGEFFDEADCRPEAGTIDPGDERDILATAQIAMKRAAKAEWKRYPGIAADPTPIGHLRAGKQPDQRRLAGAIGAEDPEIMARGEFDRRVLQHDPATEGGWIGLRDPVEGDHSGMLSLRRSTRSSENPPRSDRMARMTR